MPAILLSVLYAVLGFGVKHWAILVAIACAVISSYAGHGWAGILFQVSAVGAAYLAGKGAE